MAFDPKLLTTALADSIIKSKSDADAAVALSMPIVSPRPGLITSLVLNRADVWGFVKTSAVKAGLNSAVLAGQSAPTDSPAFAMAASANNLIGLLDGPGLLATDPQVQAVAGGLVTAGLVTHDDVNIALTVTTYRCGGVVTAADVTATRAILDLQVKLQQGQSAGMALITTARAAIVTDPSVTLPTIAEIATAVAAKLV